MKLFIKNKTSIDTSKLINFQLSILQFSNNFQNFEFSKRNVTASVFENLRIDNSLKIGNWKLKIGDLLKNVVKTDAVFIYKNELI